MHENLNIQILIVYTYVHSIYKLHYGYLPKLGHIPFKFLSSNTKLFTFTYIRLHHSP